MTKTTFEVLGLSDATLTTINSMGFQSPTPVQAQVIPLVMQGHDVLASAQTGSGKTCAFALPIIEHLLKNPQSTALMVAPTRELAEQVHKVFVQMTKNHPKLTSAFVTGGRGMAGQIKQLRAKPRCVIGTPGRLNDHIKRKVLDLSRAEVVVWDETDRMLEIGFLHQIEEIIAALPAKKQTLMFSATFPKRIVKLAQKYLVNPQRVAVGPENQVANGVTQEQIEVLKDDKFDILLDVLRTKGGSTLIFARTKRGVESMAKNLKKEGFNSDSIHGGYTQGKRNTAIKNFRDEKTDILVATDVAARGIDIPHISLVINYDLPLHAEDYIHRIGRTARAERKGHAISFISKGEKHLWADIQKFLGGGEVDPRPMGKEFRAPRRGDATPTSRRSNPRRDSSKNARFSAPRREMSDESKVTQSKTLSEAMAHSKEKSANPRPARQTAPARPEDTRTFTEKRRDALKEVRTESKFKRRVVNKSAQKDRGDFTRFDVSDRSDARRIEKTDEKREYSSRKTFGGRGESRGSSGRKSFGERNDKRASSDRKPYGDRTEKREYSDRKPYGDRSEKREFSDRKPYGERSDGRKSKSGGKKFIPSKNVQLKGRDSAKNKFKKFAKKFGKIFKGKGR